ncbi:putative transporter [Colletotrichum sp. SAR 10_86]|nr:putative transporter [Colletotrichum sp. SAR 10_86]KAJ5003577.1 putative transporter [Colletotrichum sp. SAR 10_66]
MAPKTDADVLPVKSDSEAPDIDVGQVKLMDDRDVDPALKLTGGVVIEFTPEEERQTLRKIDMNMLPLMCWVYMIQFADKTTLNYASLMGIREDTNLKGNEFSWISTNILAWGAALTCHAATHNYAGLLATRFFLGAFEATVTPAFVLITSMWYKQGEQARRVGYWLSCNGFSLIIMALIGYGLSAVEESSIAPWKILFLVLGLITVLTGAFNLWYLPDNQANAKFLDDRQRLIAIERIRDNFQGIGNRTFRADDAPLYKRGKMMVAIMYGCAALVLVVLRFVNIRENKRRDRLAAASGVELSEETAALELERSKFMDLTDFKLAHFRYVL